MEIYSKIRNFLGYHDTINVLIAGQSCSGKTTLANKICNHFKDQYSVTIISQDDYFKDHSDIPIAYGRYLLDVPDAFWIEEFKTDVTILGQYGRVYMPNYDIATNTRQNKNKIIRAGTINIIEGLHTIHIFNNLNNSMKIFISTDSNICLERRVARDTKEFGIPEMVVREYWSEFIQPISERYIFSQKSYADIIL